MFVMSKFEFSLQVVQFAGPQHCNAGERIGAFVNTAAFGLARPFDVCWCSQGLVVATHMAQPKRNSRDHRAAVSLFDGGGLLLRSCSHAKLRHPNSIVVCGRL